MAKGTLNIVTKLHNAKHQMGRGKWREKDTVFGSGRGECKTPMQQKDRTKKISELLFQGPILGAG